MKSNIWRDCAFELRTATVPNVNYDYLCFFYLLEFDSASRLAALAENNLKSTVSPLSFFFLNCFWWYRSPYCLYSPLSPIRGQPTEKCHHRWQPIQGRTFHFRLGRLLDLNPWPQFHNLVLPPMSHHCSLISPHCSLNEPSLPPKWATTVPLMSHHCSLNESPLLP